MINRFLLPLVFVCLLAPTVVLGQNYPEPASAGEPLVPCTGCPDQNASGEANDGLPLYPFTIPLVDHVGRIVDSSTTMNVQHQGMRTLRGGRVRVRPGRDRVYIALGETIAAFTLSTFFNARLQEPLVGVNTIATGSVYSRFGNPFEKLARPDAHVYAESKYSGWTTSYMDTQIVLNDFDTDDRGYVYPATLWGWGIHLDDGRTDGKHLPFVAQYAYPDNTWARAVIALKHGDTYSVVLSDRTSKTWTHNVTSPAAAVAGPTRTGTAHAFRTWSKYESGSRVAVINADGHVRVFTNQGLVAGEAALIDLTPPTGTTFKDVAFDDDGTLWVAGTTGIWKLSPVTGTGYTTAEFAFAAPSFTGDSIHASAGYIAVTGRVQNDAGQFRVGDLRLYTVANGAPELVDTDDYFRNHYQRAPMGYAQPNSVYVALSYAHLLAHGGLAYLFNNAGGLGDVYELGAVLRPPQMKVTSISPVSGPPAGGTVVTIRGRNFTQGASVTFGTANGATTFVDSFTLTAVAPPGTNGPSVEVRVTSGGQSAAAPTPFTYVFGAPATMHATATSPGSVHVMWSSVTGATMYEITLRNADGTFSPVGVSQTTTFSHTSRTPNTSYVYRVHAIDGAGNKSAASTADVATTIMFTDSIISAGMLIKAVHVRELRQAVNAMNVAAGLPAATFTDAIDAGVTVKKTHIQELRNAIAAARSALGLTSQPVADPNLHSLPVRAVHLLGLHSGVR